MHGKTNTAIVWTLRLLVGATFILSGVAKSIDPWGFVYKIGDYLSVWGLDVPHPFVVCGAVGLSLFELCTGVCVATGMLRRAAVWSAAALMAFMLPLTAYIWIADPVPDCGCFGDLWVISNGATLAKNVVVSAAVVWLILRNLTVKPLIIPYLQWLGITATLLYGLILALTGYVLQPMLDFRPFPEGFDLTTLADAEHAAADEDYVFLYAKDGGEPVEFSVDSLPDEADGWQFVDRVERHHADKPSTSAIALFDENEDDVTAEVFGQLADTTLLILVPDVRLSDMSHWRMVNQLAQRYTSVGITGGDHPQQRWQMPHYVADATAITQLARGPVAIVCTVDGRVQWKRAATLLPTDWADAQQPLDELATPPLAHIFWLLTICLAAFLILLAFPRFLLRFKKRKNIIVEK